MNLIQEFNTVIDREMGKLSKEQESALEQAMVQFDQLVRAGIVQPERYKIEPISTISGPRVACHPISSDAS